MSEKKHCCQQSPSSATNAPLNAQMRWTTGPFAQWNHISRTFNIPKLSKSTKARSYL